jgi:hypothetical protein
MTAIEFLKKNIELVVVGVVSAVLVTRWEPFKSDFLLALLMAAGVGLMVGIVGERIRKIAGRRRDGLE